MSKHSVMDSTNVEAFAKEIFEKINVQLESITQDLKGVTEEVASINSMCSTGEFAAPILTDDKTAYITDDDGVAIFCDWQNVIKGE